MGKELNEVIGEFSQEDRDEIERNFQEANEEVKLLKQIREVRSQSQTGVGRKMGVGQAQVSKIESSGSTLQVGTLRRYLNSLGFQLEIVARDQEGHTVEIGINDLDEELKNKDSSSSGVVAKKKDEEQGEHTT